MKTSLINTLSKEILLEHKQTSGMKKRVDEKQSSSIFKYSDSDDHEGDNNLCDDSDAAANEDTANQQAVVIVSQYLNEPPIGQHDNPLGFWTSKGRHFGLLAKVAIKYLTLQASSTASERFFSSSGVFVNKLSSSMADHTLSNFVFLPEMMHNEGMWKIIREEAVKELS